MSPILVRPLREQLEHDRVIRLLQAKHRRRFEAAMNPGAERNTRVGSGAFGVYPDLVLQSPERRGRLRAVVEVETGESVNHLEALAQWAHFAKLRAAFHLYVPFAMVDVARQLCQDNQIHVNEIWSYHPVGDEVRFTLILRSREAPTRSSRRKARPSSQPRTKSAKPAARARASRKVSPGRGVGRPGRRLSGHARRGKRK